MKIILDDVCYQGYYFERLDFELPNVKNLEDVTIDMLVEYLFDDLDNYINFHESFMVDGKPT